MLVYAVKSYPIHRYAEELAISNFFLLLNSIDFSCEQDPQSLLRVFKLRIIRWFGYVGLLEGTNIFIPSAEPDRYSAVSSNEQQHQFRCSKDLALKVSKKRPTVI